MDRLLKISEISVLNKETYKKRELPSYLNYLDTGSLTRNKVESYQLLDISKDKIPSRAQRKVNVGTILYSTVRPNQEHFGFVDQLVDNLIVSTGFTTIDVIDEDIYPKYLYYKIIQSYITAYLHTIGMNSVSSYPSISPNDLGRLKFKFPDYKTQKKIAKVLSDLDTKIELNNKINARLEAMAKLIYDYWFVQFDFPDENGKPYKSSGGKMVFNEELKREIPEGWEVKRLGVLGNFKNGVNYDPSNPGEVACPIINVRNISASSYFLKYEDLDVIYLRESDVRKYAVHEGSIIIARSGIPGATRLISDFEENTLYCGFAIHYQLENLIQKTLVFFYLKSIEQMIRNGSGGTILKNVNQATLNDLKITLPKNDNVIIGFNKKIDPIFDKINLVQKENQKLSELRDWLLPMLMNGQVSVGEAEEKWSMAAEPEAHYNK